MKRKVSASKQSVESSIPRPPKWRGLQARMTFSYALVMGASLLILEVLLLTLLTFAVRAIFWDGVYPYVAGQLAREYAFAAALQANGEALDPQATFLPGHPDSLLPSPGWSNVSLPDGGGLSIPYTSTTPSDPETVVFGLLIAPNGDVLASSYPQQYPSNTPISTLLPSRAHAITTALAGGKASSATEQISGGLIAWAAAAVWSRERKPIGAIYLQGPMPPIIRTPQLGPTAFLLIASGLALLIIVTPIGGLFGLITTRGLVRRVRRLVSATTEFASGNYGQRVSVKRRDEIGQLEAHFNQMAEQLVESIRARQELAGQNARLAERARISRELHDAVSQDLFSLRMLVGGMQRALPSDSPLVPQITALQEMATTMIREMRALLLELRPTQLEHLGLAEALEDLATAYRTRLGITVTTAITTTPLPAAAEQAILRITQEALSNAARHADATAITLDLTQQEETITLTITDNGQGFDPAAGDTQQGIGLRSMQERIQELGGAFTLESAPGQGTRVQVRLPRAPEHVSQTGANP